MAYRKIIQVGDPLLREISQPVEKVDDEIVTLLDDMKETVEKAEGAGLAAVQIGVLKRVFVINVEEGYFEFINPQIVKQAGSQKGKEGCLSVQHKERIVERPNKVVVKALDRNGKAFKLTAYGFAAKAVCHEYDHLEGILYTDKALSIEASDQ